MTDILRTSIFIISIALASTGYGQKGITTVGLQFKPVIPVSFFSDVATATDGDITAELKPTLGYSFGMVVRRGFSDLFSLETGINYVQRNYDYTYSRSELGFSEQGDITFIGYEIPVLALVYIRLGEQVFMNTAAGLSADFFPSDVTTTSEELQLYMFRSNWVQGSVVANIGFELRTVESGYFYLGASYHRPFTRMAVAEFTHYEDGFPTSVRTDVSGTYLTLDLRYFFYNDPKKQKKREIDRSTRDGF